MGPAYANSQAAQSPPQPDPQHPAHQIAGAQQSPLYGAPPPPEPTPAQPPMVQPNNGAAPQQQTPHLQNPGGMYQQHIMNSQYEQGQFYASPQGQAHAHPQLSRAQQPEPQQRPPVSPPFNPVHTARNFEQLAHPSNPSFGQGIEELSGQAEPPRNEGQANPSEMPSLDMPKGKGKESGKIEADPTDKD